MERFEPILESRHTELVHPLLPALWQGGTVLLCQLESSQAGHLPAHCQVSYSTNERAAPPLALRIPLVGERENFKIVLMFHCYSVNVFICRMGSIPFTVMRS